MARNTLNLSRVSSGVSPREVLEAAAQVPWSETMMITAEGSFRKIRSMLSNNRSLVLRIRCG